MVSLEQTLGLLEKKKADLYLKGRSLFFAVKLVCPNVAS